MCVEIENIVGENKEFHTYWVCGKEWTKIKASSKQDPLRWSPRSRTLHPDSHNSKRHISKVVGCCIYD